jgi:hypothetical protein
MTTQLKEEGGRKSLRKNDDAAQERGRKSLGKSDASERVKTSDDAAFGASFTSKTKPKTFFFRLVPVSLLYLFRH